MTPEQWLWKCLTEPGEWHVVRPYGVYVKVARQIEYNGNQGDLIVYTNGVYAYYTTTDAFLDALRKLLPTE
jgi:hypothetical protein